MAGEALLVGLLVVCGAHVVLLPELLVCTVRLMRRLVCSILLPSAIRPDWTP
jgi:hypothetical protein